jgi:lactate permease
MRRLVVPVVILGIVMASVQYIVATSGPWNIGAFMAGLAGLLVGIPIAYRTRGQVQNDNSALDTRALLIAVSGYVVLIGITLIVQLIPAAKLWLGQFVIQVDFPEVSTALGYITPAGPGRKLKTIGHTGMILVYTSIIAYIIYSLAGLYQPGSIARILDGTVRRVMASSVSIASMVTMAVVMETAGMTDVLAQGLAQGVGVLFPLVAPWIGGMGAFMTGSNTNSNVVFGALQMRTAELLGYSVAIILAAQTAGAALASVMAPTKVVVGSSTAGMAGKEGDVMRHLLVYTAILVGLISFLTAIAVWLYF